MPPRSPSRAPSGPTWRDIEPAPVILLSGSEEFFAVQARRRVVERVRESVGEAEIHDVSAKDYTPGALSMATSPSLFGDARVVVVRDVERMSDEFLTEALPYVQSPDQESVVILHHGGGNRGKRLLDAIKKAKHPVVECKPLKNDRDKMDFVYQLFRSEERRIEPDAARVLIAAAGTDVAELAAASQQLMADGPATITDAVVEKYYGGRVEVTAFKVADAAVSGKSGFALRALRQALDSGVDPVPLVGALSMRVRHIAQVHGRRENSSALAKSLGMAPWQVEQAQRDSRRFSSESLSRVIRGLATADAQVKGEGHDPVYALERAVLTLSTAGSRGRNG
ncbi:MULTISPECIES: DNA polymerase III subunit delta [Kocuria]|uniref:DNA polymerase III subunit delta n=1 Tax=Kocuria TaxID=57493 RepID=UPI000A427A2A|nr:MULTISPECIES: DNA polymerase III subunit delta [Kocuria]MCT1366780.1 DNA polymerase III subunit delta [Rothia sp. p3-SID1597]